MQSLSRLSKDMQVHNRHIHTCLLFALRVQSLPSAGYSYLGRLSIRCSLSSSTHHGVIPHNMSLVASARKAAHMGQRQVFLLCCLLSYMSCQLRSKGSKWLKGVQTWLLLISRHHYLLELPTWQCELGNVQRHQQHFLHLMEYVERKPAFSPIPTGLPLKTGRRALLTQVGPSSEEPLLDMNTVGAAREMLALPFLLLSASSNHSSIMKNL